jgi:lysophospholipase L1-like esterase
MAIMCKYSLAVTDSTDTMVVQRTFRSGSLTLSRRAGSASSNSRYNTVKIFMGHNKDSVAVKISYNGITDKQIVPPNESLQIITFQLSAIPNQLKITFDGFRTPEVYGISLEQPNGIFVDNIPMRGCSGTIFYKLNYLLTSQMFAALKPNLFIFQYGGNVVPYLQTAKEVSRFAQSFKNNISRIKKMCPNASFLVIGPADMSKKIAGKMQTYPILPFVRDELKRVAQELGGAYFDMYEVMGGENSMPSWVDSNPPLAAKDYIHFSPKGASKIAELFYEALMLDYETYLIRTGKKKEK